MSRSLIDHCYTNVPEKIHGPQVLALGSSDHMALYLTKHCKSQNSRPKEVIRILILNIF